MAQLVRQPFDYSKTCLPVFPAFRLIAFFFRLSGKTLSSFYVLSGRDGLGLLDLLSVNGSQNRVLILQWSSKIPGNEQVQNITIRAALPICKFVRMSDVSHILRCLICLMHILGLHRQPRNWRQNCELPYINYSTLRPHCSTFQCLIFCVASPVPLTRHMMQLCKTRTPSVCYPVIRLQEYEYLWLHASCYCILWIRGLTALSTYKKLIFSNYFLM